MIARTLSWLHFMEWMGAEAGRPAYRRAHRLSQLPGRADTALDRVIAAGLATEDMAGMRLTDAGRQRLGDFSEVA